MKVLLAPTEDFIKRQRTILADAAIPGSGATINVENTDGFEVDDYIVIGPEGSEAAELCQVSAVDTGLLTVTTMLLTHTKDEPVVKYRYNQRKFYGALTLGGSYAELTSSGSPAAIGVSDPQGTYLEYTGGEGYLYFKSTYYNSETSDETAIADSTGTLADESARYCSLFAIKRQAGLLNNPYINDAVIETYRRRAENEVNSYVYARYVLPLQNSAGVQEVPFVIENATMLLAAGYLDYQEYGSEGEGVKWLGEARGLLCAIRDGKQRLIGTDMIELEQKTLTQGVQSYPDSVDNKNGPIQMFTTKQKF